MNLQKAKKAAQLLEQITEAEKVVKSLESFVEDKIFVVVSQYEPTITRMQPHRNSNFEQSYYATPKDSSALLDQLLSRVALKAALQEAEQLVKDLQFQLENL